MTIKCFDYGGPHKKVDCPNHMTLGAFMTFCGDSCLEYPKFSLFEYPDVELEIGQLKAIQEWVEEDKLHFESKRDMKRDLFGLEGGNLAKPSQSIRQEEVEVANPSIVRGVRLDHLNFS